MSDWKTVKISDVAEVFDGPHATPKKVQAGPIFLGISSLDSGRLRLEASDNISEEDFTQWTKRVTPRPGDIVFSYETRIGQAAIIPPGLRCCLGRRMGLVRPKEGLDARFFLYQYLSPAYQAFLRSRTIHGSTVDRIPLVEFPEFPIAIPNLHEQRSIAHILGTLDDKIELNRRMNETLEAMARAIFQSWFVDFDPVRAKASGESIDSICQRLGLTPELLALFPDSFEDSELGDIPAGWNAGSLANFASFQNGFAFKTKDWTNSGHPVVKIGNVKPGIIDLSGCSFVAHETVKGLDRFSLKRGDLLADVTQSPLIGSSDEKS